MSLRLRSKDRASSSKRNASTLDRLNRAWTRFEVALCGLTAAALAFLLCTWVILKGLASRTTDASQSGLLVRAILGSLLLGALVARVTKRRTAAVLPAALVGLGVSWWWRDAGVLYFANLLGWLQDGSSLTLLGGVRGLGTRLTLWLALLGGSLATASGRHVTIDLVTRALGAKRNKTIAVGVAAIAALVCIASAWGFVDFIALDAFGATSQDSRIKRVTRVNEGMQTHLFVLRRQLALDLQSLPKVLAGRTWDRCVSGAEWNAWLEGGDWAAHYGREAAGRLREAEPAAARAPLVSVPGRSPRGIVIKSFDLVIPFGLLLIGLRFILWCLRGGAVERESGVLATATAPNASSSGRRRRANFFAAAGLSAALGTAGLLAGPLAVLAGALAFMGLPLFTVLAGGAELAWLSQGSPLNRLAPKVLEEQFAGSPVLVTIPLFTLLGYLLAESKAPQRMVAGARALFGPIPGGLALVCLVASAFFTSLTGGSGVTIVAIGGLLLPTLLEQGYSERFSIGLVTTGGSLGLLFPPSLPILVYSLVAGVDFIAAFKAALLPGILVMIVLGAYAVYIGRREKIALDGFNLVETGRAIWRLKWELLLPVLLLGSISLSVAGLDEAAALGVLYTATVVLLVHRDVAWRDLPRILKQSMALSGAVILILMMANALMNFVIDQQVPAKVLDALVALGLNQRWQFLLALNLFLLVVGMVMDSVSAIIVAVPLVLPFAARFGLAPFHMAAMFVLNLELAFAAPPLGLNLFIASFRFQRPVVSLYRSVLPFVALLALSLGVLIAAPWLSTALVQPDIDRARARAARLNVAPREAWLLECVQEDITNPKPCTAEDQRRWVPTGARDADQEANDALLQEMLKTP